MSSIERPGCAERAVFPSDDGAVNPAVHAFRHSLVGPLVIRPIIAFCFVGITAGTDTIPRELMLIVGLD